MAQSRLGPLLLSLGLVAGGAAVAVVAASYIHRDSVAAPAPTKNPTERPTAKAAQRPAEGFLPNRTRDSSGFFQTIAFARPWPPDATLEQIAEEFRGLGRRKLEELEREFPRSGPVTSRFVMAASVKTLLFNYDGDPDGAYELLTQTRRKVEADPALAREWLYTLIYLQGVDSLRKGENDNCVLCRGESSCILPIAPAATHTIPAGSRRAIAHFAEYLDQFPDDLEARWLLNLAHMTLGEYPERVDPRYLISLDLRTSAAHGIGRFRDVGHLAGVNRFNESGGAIMEDLDNDGRLDVVATAIDPTQAVGFYRSLGDGTFGECAISAGIADQLGGLACVQTDYDNDGFIDVYIPRGAWYAHPIRPTLLRNAGDGTFEDVTREARLLDPVNSNCATWADYDSDGWADLLVCCERQANRLFHNERDGTFAEVAARAGVAQDEKQFCKGGVWIDYDNDDFPDVFLNNLHGTGRLYHNRRDGTFSDESAAAHVDGPNEGFPCFAWDYDNDGWLDVFATTYQYQRSAADVIRGMLGNPHEGESNRLFHNRGGEFEDVTRGSGLEVILTAMGCNFADFDNDGFLDAYFGTGAPGFNFLVPNRMFRNLDGKKFADISASSGTGHLQKGHGVACGDWDRDGDVDIFAQMGGPARGDMYHNVLFRNPGQRNHWLNLKLVGRKSTRTALGARIKVVTAGESPRTIHRHVSTGGSFGANTFEQTIGLGPDDRAALLEIHWPASGITQSFRDLPADRAVQIVESADRTRELDSSPLKLDAKFAAPSTTPKAMARTTALAR